MLVLPSSLRGRASLAVNSFLELGRSFNLYLTADIDTCASPPAILIPEDRAEKSPRTAQEYLPTYVCSRNRKFFELDIAEKLQIIFFMHKLLRGF